MAVEGYEESPAAGMEELARLYPERDTQIKLICDALGIDGLPSPASMHLYDPNTPASTLSLLRQLLSSSVSTVVVIDPLVCSTPRSLFHHVWSTIDHSSFATVPAVIDDSIDVFLGVLTSYMETLMQMKRKLVFVIARAERIRDVWPEHITEGLYNLAERVNARGSLTLVTISCLPVSHFRTTRGVGLTDAIVVAFPRLSKADALSSLLIDVHQLIQSDKRHSLPFQSLLNIHETFREVAYDSFASEIRDMDEIRLLACCVWYPYIEPLLQGVVPANKATSLLLRGSFLFRDALSRLHTREIAPAEWVQEMVNHVKRDCEAEVAKGVAGQRPILPSSKTMLLPLIPSFLLLASFLASYNPARLDVRYFVRDESFLLPEAGVKNGHSSKKRKSTNRRGTEGNRQEMLGPKTFTMDRLLSIFQALMAEAGPEMDVWVGEEESQVKSDWWEIKSKSVGVMEGVNALIRINALVRTSANEKLESTTLFRTNVTFETAMQVSKRPSFDLEEWLWDWR